MQLALDRTWVSYLISRFLFPCKSSSALGIDRLRRVVGGLFSKAKCIIAQIRGFVKTIGWTLS